MGRQADTPATRIAAKYHIDVGVAVVYTDALCQRTMIDAICEALEAESVESVWAAEHTVVPENYISSYPYTADRKMPGGSRVPVVDPFILLATIAANTSELRVGTGIAILPQRNPVILAKEAASLDVLSGGRLELGVGIGWLKEEFEAVGASFADRGRRADEYICAMRALWGQDETFTGKYVTFSDARCYPKPEKGSIPIIVAGHSPSAARRAGKLGDGFFAAAHDGLGEFVNILRREAEQQGRSMDNIRMMTFATYDPKVLRELCQLGFTRFVVHSPLPSKPNLFAEQLRSRLEAFETALASGICDSTELGWRTKCH